MNPNYFVKVGDIPKLGRIQHVFRMRNQDSKRQQIEMEDKMRRINERINSPDTNFKFGFLKLCKGEVTEGLRYLRTFPNIKHLPRDTIRKKIEKMTDMLRQAEECVSSELGRAISLLRVAVRVIGDFPCLRCLIYARMVLFLRQYGVNDRDTSNKLLEYTSRILLFDPENLVMLRQRSLQYKRLGKIEKLVDDLCVLVRLQPQNDRYRAALRKYQKILEIREPESLYQFLGISSTATRKEIIKKCKKLKIKFHPDLGGEDEFEKKKLEEIFKKVGEAENILTDSVKRPRYDADLADGALFSQYYSSEEEKFEGTDNYDLLESASFSEIKDDDINGLMEFMKRKKKRKEEEEEEEKKWIVEDIELMMTWDVFDQKWDQWEKKNKIFLNTNKK